MQKLSLNCAIMFRALSGLVIVLGAMRVSGTDREQLGCVHGTTLIIISRINFVPLSPTRTGLFFKFISSVSRGASLVVASGGNFSR